MVPVHWLEWASKWTVYWLSGSAVLEVLEYVGTLSIVFGVVAYFAESGDRAAAIAAQRPTGMRDINANVVTSAIERAAIGRGAANAADAKVSIARSGAP